MMAKRQSRGFLRNPTPPQANLRPAQHNDAYVLRSHHGNRSAFRYLLAIRPDGSRRDASKLAQLLLATLLILFSTTPAPPAHAAPPVSFATQIQPLLEAKCLSCHGAEKQEGNLRLDSFATAKRGGDQGPALVPGDVAKSLLVRAITFRDPNLQMPPKQKLSEKEIATLTEWVKAGADWPDSSRTIGGARTSSSDRAGDAFTDSRNPVRQAFGGERFDLWSLQPPKSSQRSIDELVRQALDRDGAKLEPEADPRTLIRRLTFDLLGLPPAFDEVEAFVREWQAETNAAKNDADRSAPPRVYQELVDRLLDSPRYGERQARLWLDVVRYADTHGYERDEFRPLIYQYRDYVVRSFNQDKPFDQFVREQLAGDELALNKSREAATRTSAKDLLVATGFLRLGQWDSTAAIFQEETRLRAEMMADLTNTTASAFLGLTFSCCQCHDHKYDPFTQADHFRLRAFFAAVESQDDTVVSPPDELAEIARHNEALAVEAAPLKQEQAALLDGARQRVEKDRRAKLTPDERQAIDSGPADDDDARKKKRQTTLDKLKVSDGDARAALDEDARRRDAELTRRLDALEAKKREPRKAMTARDSGSSAPATHVFFQGDFSSPREAVEPGFPSVFAPGPAAVAAPADSTTGRRLALATWIASDRNPWTARVIVNRVWQQHFGIGLVATPNDFGFSGARPSHPELLDTLAVDFQRGGWSPKRLHRAIVSSATYRQRVPQTVDASVAAPPDSHAPLRQSIRRVDAETLRDALLSVSGLLKPYDAGPPLWPPVPSELLLAQPAILEAEKGGDGGRRQGWYANTPEETDVRSLFLVRKRSLPIPFLQAFDLPDTTVSCARRDTTVVAPQALMMLNSADSVRYATALADRLLADQRAADQRFDSLMQRALARRPRDDERALATDFLRRHEAEHAKRHAPDEAARRALIDLTRAVLNLNEFAYLD